MKWILFIGLFCAAVGCSYNSAVLNGSYKYLYDYESRELHPEYIVYHSSDDSSTVFFRVRSSELLYARGGSHSPFIAKIQIKTTSSEAYGQVTDTSSITITDNAKERQGWLLGSFKVKLPQGQWSLLIDFSDLTKNISQPSFLAVDKTSKLSAQNYLVRKYESGEPLFGGFATTGQRLQIESARNQASGAPKLLQMSGEIKLPPPPFSSNSPEMPDITGSTITNFQTDEAGHLLCDVQSGNYFLTHDPFMKSGLTIKTTSTYYPEVMSVDALQWPLRYITTKTEHDEIVKNNYPKLMIDKFWLECAGNKDHARELIKIYYHRVEEANYYFSTYTEGWRTDRGMIHLVFGNPTKINKFQDTETWQYGEDGAAGLLSFVFKRVESPLSGNIYVLDRDAGFKPYWERGVQAWRNGRVYND